MREHVVSATSGCYQSDIFEATLVFETLFAVEILENQLAASTEELADSRWVITTAAKFRQAFIAALDLCGRLIGAAKKST